MANKQKQMLAVWGSPGGGKTVTAVKLALELSKRKKNVVLVFTDVTAPTLPSGIDFSTPIASPSTTSNPITRHDSTKARLISIPLTCIP